MDSPCHHHGLLERNGKRNSTIGAEDIRRLTMSIIDSDKALLDEILLRVCLIEETIQAYIPRFRQHILYLSILLVGIGVFLCIHAVGLCLHVAVKFAVQFFDLYLKVEQIPLHSILFMRNSRSDPSLQVNIQEIQGQPSEKTSHENAQTRVDTPLPSEGENADEESTLSKLSQEIAIKEELGHKESTKSNSTSLLVSPADLAHEPTSIARPSLSGHKTFSIEDILAHKIRLLEDGEDGESPKVLLYRAINLQDINTSSALLDMGKWNDSVGPDYTFPIHEAAIIGNNQLFNVVLKNTKDKWIGSLYGSGSKTALEYAAFHGHKRYCKHS
jgi:hypothetical protein